MIKRLIKSIRRQPKVKRDGIAVGIAGTFTAIVFMVWLYHMPDRISAITEKKTDNSSSSFSQFFDEINNQASAIKTSISEGVDPKEETEAVETIAGLQDIFLAGSTTSTMLIASSTATSSSIQTSNHLSTSSSNAEVQSTTSVQNIMRIVTTSSSSSPSTTAEGQ